MREQLHDTSSIEGTVVEMLALSLEARRITDANIAAKTSTIEHEVEDRCQAVHQASQQLRASTEVMAKEVEFCRKELVASESKHREEQLLLGARLKEACEARDLLEAHHASTRAAHEDQAWTPHMRLDHCESDCQSHDLLRAPLLPANAMTMFPQVNSLQTQIRKLEGEAVILHEAVESAKVHFHFLSFLKHEPTNVYMLT